MPTARGRGVKHGTETYAREENRSSLGADADAMLDGMRDTLASLVRLSELENYLAHSSTRRLLERLRFTPGAHALWAEMVDRITAAQEWALDDIPCPECEGEGWLRLTSSSDLTRCPECNPEEPSPP